IGVDGAMEEAVRPFRDVVHPPAVGEHVDDDEPETPVQAARDAAPARNSIPDHGGRRLNNSEMARPDSGVGPCMRFGSFQICPAADRTAAGYTAARFKAPVSQPRIG